IHTIYYEPGRIKHYNSILLIRNPAHSLREIHASPTRRSSDLHEPKVSGRMGFRRTDATLHASRRSNDATPSPARTVHRDHRGRLLVPGDRRAAGAGRRTELPGVDAAHAGSAELAGVRARGAADA